ncbi:hypothetical protein ACWGE1_07200 [Streptomyces sp. NPDC054932]
MAANQGTSPARRLRVGIAAGLALDFLATLVISFGLFAIGLLLPGITEDYGPATGPGSPTALAFFGAAVALICSLALTAGLLSRARTDRARRLALSLSAGRLTLLVVGVATLVVYGIVTIELA